MSIQVLIPPALAALHNFIRKYDPDEIEMYADDETLEVGLEIGARAGSVGELGTGSVTREETDRANERRDRIAGAMWEQYQGYLESREALR